MQQIVANNDDFSIQLSRHYFNAEKDIFEKTKSS